MKWIDNSSTAVSRLHELRRENEKELHQLRLRFKAVRVQCLILAFAYPERYQSKVLFVPFREYYRQTSRLRDLTVARQRFRKICRNYHLRYNGFMKDLWQHYREETIKLKRLPVPDIDNFEKTHRHEIAAEKIKETIGLQMEQLIEKVLESRSRPEAGLNLHWQRKQLKKLIYLNRMLPDSIPLLDEVTTARLELLDTKLGAWHDLQVLLQLVGQFAGRRPRGHTRRWLPEITRAIVTEQIRVLESLTELIS